MRIGIDIRVLMDKKFSGVSEYAANLLMAILKNANKEDHFILYYNCGQNIEKRMSKWDRENVTIIASHYPNKFYNYFLQKIFSYPKIDKLIPEVDVFWSPHFNFSSFSKNNSKLKKIITVHDLSFLRYPEFFNLRQNIWHKLLGVKKIIKKSDKIIAISENTKNDIIELVGISPEKIKVVYSGNNLVKREVGAEEIKNLRNKYFKGKDFNYLLYLGTIEPRKNILNLIKAYNIYRENINNFPYKLVLVGRFGWKTKKIFKEYEKSFFKKDIIFLDYVSASDKEVLYSQAKLFIYPSFYEGFGFPPLEAMTYHIPVISSNTSSIPEVVADSALMVNPAKDEEIAEAMTNILDDEELYNYYVSQSAKRATYFSWDETAKQYLKIFKDLSNE